MAKNRSRKAPAFIALDESLVSAPEPTVEPAPNVYGITLERDGQGRIVVSAPNEAKRIAGSDSALPEVLRQLGVDLINRNRI